MARSVLPPNSLKSVRIRGILLTNNQTNKQTNESKSPPWQRQWNKIKHFHNIYYNRQSCVFVCYKKYKI